MFFGWLGYKFDSIVGNLVKYNTPIVLAYFKQHGLPPCEPEYRFCKERKWRADFAFVNEKILLEIEGGVFTRGRHLRPTGFLADCEKYNKAAVLGWRVLRVQPKDLLMPETIEMLKEILL